jgi:hypothetical protein
MAVAAMAENLNFAVGLNCRDCLEARFIRLAHAESLMTVIAVSVAITSE